MPAGFTPQIAASTQASTTPVSTTDAIGNAILGVFQDPKVQTSIGGALGQGINDLLGIKVGGEADPAALAAAKAAAEAEKKQMLIIGGAIAVVVVVIVAVVVVNR